MKVIDTRAARENAPQSLHAGDGRYIARDAVTQLETNARMHLRVPRDRLDLALRMLEQLDCESLAYVRDTLNELYPAPAPAPEAA